jgi:serine phosphatase RsbU (regulator of sigma subunit)
LNEAVNEKNEQLGTDAMMNIVKVFRAFPSRTIVTNIENAVHTFRGSTALYDDLTLVVVKTSSM